MLAPVIAAIVIVAGCDQAVGLLASARPPSAPDQTGPAVQLGAGVGPEGPWTWWLYPTAAGACIELVEGGRRGESSCMSGSEPFTGDIGIGATGGNETVLAWGSTALPDAAVVVVTAGAGAQVRVPLVRPADPLANGHGYFIARFAPNQLVNLIVLLDATGRELERYPMGPPGP
jgi:hypothetical protein